MQELARRLREMCESHGLGEWGASGFDYAAFIRGLDAIASLPGCRGCLQGGGRGDCELRACATGRGLRACSFCADRNACPHEKIREHMRSGAADAGLLVLRCADEHDMPEERVRRELASLWWWRALFGGSD
jgi:hypothetical protein